MDWDVFISYASADDEPISTETTGRITRLAYDLKTLVGQTKLGRETNVFFDANSIKASEFLETAVRKGVRGSLVFVPIVSPFYIKSRWCIKELAIFSGAIQLAQEKLRSRIVPVLLEHVKIEELPPPLPAIVIKHKYFGKDGQPFDKDAYERFVIELAQQIGDLIKCESAQARPSKATVYVAAATTDLEADRADICRELMARDYSILPEGPSLPMNVKELEATVVKNLDSCIMSLHFVGKSYGIAPEDSPRSVIQIQQEAVSSYKEKIDKNNKELEGQREAREQSYRRFSQIVWCPPQVEEIMDPRHREYFDGFKNPRGFEFSRDLLEPFKSHVLETLDTLRKLKEKDSSEVLELGRAREAKKAVGSGAPRLPVAPKVYLICEDRDREAVVPIEEFLYSKGYVVELPLESTDQLKVARDHAENLRDSQAVLIYYGTSDQDWVRAKTRDCRKARMDLGDSVLYLRSRLIYIGPEPNGTKNTYRNPEFHIRRRYAPFDPDDPKEVEPIVNELRELYG